MDSKSIKELGVSFQLSPTLFSALGSKNVQKRCKLRASRTIALACLSCLSKQTYGHIAALETGGGFGLAGLQWLKHLGSDIKVSINTNPELKEHVETCFSEQGCPAGTVQVLEDDPNIVMHSKKFMFVYAEVYGSVVRYLDAAVRSVNHNGLLYVTSTDTAVLQNKSPATARRLYGANMWKTEYYKEMGARVIISNISRAAARWEKGIKVELCMALEHEITVVCRMLRGSKHGESTVSCLQSLAHCQLCQARQFIPESLFLKDKYSHYNLCDCAEDSLAAPILLLGPMWGGSICNKTFLFNVLHELQVLNLAPDECKLLELMIIESTCCNSEDEEDKVITCIKTITKYEKSEPDEKRRKIEAENTATTIDTRSTNQTEHLPNMSNFSTTKLPYSSSEVHGDTSNSPPFYFDSQHHSVKGGNPPTLHSVITKLRENGHHASKTHFGPRCIRTSASLKAFKDILQTIWNETCQK